MEENELQRDVVSDEVDAADMEAAGHPTGKWRVVLAICLLLILVGSTALLSGRGTSEDGTAFWHWPEWIAILPPFVAIALAILTTRVVLSLWIACAFGFLFTIGPYSPDWIAKSIGSPVISLWNNFNHLQVVAFTLMMGAMVRVMSDSGGTRALIERFAGLTRTRERTQLLTSGMGLAVFFDDYANTLFIGSTMRPVIDEQRISREKLAFLVDATAAPVAGLAIVSTWVGVELGYIAEAYAELGLGTDVYTIFLTTIPYRFYPVYLLAFVWMVAWTGRDFGPMAAAEERALRHSAESAAADEVEEPTASKVPAPATSTGTLKSALLPLTFLLGAMIAGLFGTGWLRLAEANQAAVAAGKSVTDPSLWAILDKSLPYETLTVASALGLLTALGTALLSNRMPFAAAVRSAGRGVMDMLPAILILALAWTLASLCSADQLDTAGFLVDLIPGNAPVWIVPTVVFLLAAAISFAIGSSWSTMAILMPLAIKIAFALLVLRLTGAEIATHPIMLSTIGAVLAGAIFGDHCSPISDTTVLSSAASGCDHLRHVATQLPYAVTVGIVSIVMGSIPVALGVSNWIVLPLGLISLYAIIRLMGRRVAA